MMPKPSGHTNAQLSERTRRRLLDATIESLSEVGYAKTTTPEIARRAGVSRGALAHHFPTKASIVAEAVDHLFSRNTAEFGERFQALPLADRTFGAAVDLLWEMFQGDTFRAGLELTVAGGSDPELGASVHRAVMTFQRVVARRFVELFGATGDEDHGMTSDAVVFAFAAVLGAGVYRQVGLDTLAEQSIATLRLLAEAVMPGLGVGGSAVSGRVSASG